MSEGDLAPTIIFVHIPKAAGGTLRTILARGYAKDEVLHIHGGEEVLRAMSPDRRRRLKVVQGHWRFGLHELLPQPATYVTMLREPVDRIISHYYYVLSEPKHRLHERVKNDGISLEEYVELPIGELENGQTRLISGVAKVAYGACGPDLLERAKQNLLEHFSVVGLKERFDDSLKLMQDRFGWGDLRYKKKHVSSARPGREEVSPEIRDAIKTHNQLDLKLYDFAVELFERAWTERG